MTESLKVKFKSKVLILGLVLVMLAGFFGFANQARAESLKMTLLGSTNVNQPFQIKITTSDEKKGIVIEVFVSEEDKQWVKIENQGRCTTDESGSCNINITATKLGSFYLSAKSQSTSPVYTPTATASPINITNAQPTTNLAVSANPTYIRKGEKSEILVMRPDKKEGMVVSFAGVASTAFSKTKCTTDTSGQCSVTFEPKGVAFQNSASYDIIVTSDGYNQTSVNINYIVPNSQPTQPDNLGVAMDKNLECVEWFGVNISDCLVYIAYPLFFQFPAFILTTSAKLFNAMLSLTISSKLYTQSTFIPEAWAVVRDISNIFFILILLYTAVQVILGLSHDSKKIIAQVVVMAMLINFSMFFTKIVIDSSNVLALIFFNKIAIKGADKAPIPYQPSFNSGVPEKDMGGAIASGFNPAALMKPEMFEGRIVPLPGPGNKTAIIPTPGPSFYLAIIFISCAIFLYAAYAFFIAAISFLGRLIELWILIIFSPFAFMSSALPALDHIEGFGWKRWLDKLLSTAFMAPIFMFFMYVITKIISSMDVFTGMQNTTSTSAISDLLLIIIPAIISITLLMKAVSYAKKGGGQFSSTIMSVGKMVGGLALGVATGGAALAATGTLGKLSSKALSAKGEGWKERSLQGGMGGWAAKMALKATNLGANASFDVRKSPLGGLAAKAGLDLSKGTGVLGLGGKEGGYKGAVKRKQEKEEKEKETFKTTMSDEEVQAWAEKNKKINPETGKYYSSANELNAVRLKSYQANLGKTGLMYGLSETAVRATLKITNKTATEEEIATWAQRVKIGIGATAVGVLTGGIGGLGAISGLGAAAITGGEMYSTKDARKGAAKAISKEAEKLSKAAAELKRIKEKKDELTKIMESVEADYAKNKQGDESMNDYVSRTLAEIETSIDEQRSEEQEINTKLAALKTKKAENEANGVVETFSNLDEQIKTFQTRMGELRKARIETTGKKIKYETSRTAQDRISTLGNRENALNESTKVHPADNKKGGKIPTSSGGGSGHVEKHEEHESADNHAAPSGKTH